jgi:hypothetical protein
MAVVLLGGVFTTTLASLFVLPTLHLRFGRRAGTAFPEEERLDRWAEVAPAPVAAAPVESTSGGNGSDGGEPRELESSV